MAFWRLRYVLVAQYYDAATLRSSRYHLYNPDSHQLKRRQSQLESGDLPPFDAKLCWRPVAHFIRSPACATINARILEGGGGFKS